MDNNFKTAIVLRDSDGNFIIDEEGRITCTCEDGLTFKVAVDIIDFNSTTLQCDVDGIQVIVPLQDNDPSEVRGENEPAGLMGAVTEEPPSFAWTDASTKLLLTLFKDKRDLVASRKIKTHKLMWKQISDEMRKYNYMASPIQVENKYKTMERAYKKMISTNNKTGRGRVTCSFQNELTELLANKHSIAPLAVSGRTGLMVRASTSENAQRIPQLTLSNSSSPTATDVENTPSTSSNMEITSEPSTSTNFDIIPEPSTSTNMAITPEPLNSSMTCRIPSATRNNGESQRSGQMGATAKSLIQCKEAINKLTAEIKEQRYNREKIQVEMLQEQKKMVKLQEEFNEAAKQQRAYVNQQREEKNELLRQVLQLLQAQQNKE